MEKPRLLVVHAATAVDTTLSYQESWPRAFARDARFDATLIDAAHPPRLRYPSRRGWDAVVLLHSVFSNERPLRDRLYERVAAIEAPKAWFIGNEYKLMGPKMEFAEDLGVSLLVSQCTSERVHELYRKRLGCTVVGIPNAGLDTEMFAPARSEAERTIDLGYRAYPGPLYLGHDERERLAEAFTVAVPRLGLTVDLSLAPGDRFIEREWAAFLNRCRGQLGFEAGTDYFELDDALRERVNAFVAEHQDATLDDVRARFLADYDDPVPCRVLSSRVVEAAGTRTAQLLIEGDYAGVFEADVHYIPLRTDLSNLDEAVAKFRDDDVRRTVTEHAYLAAREQLTFPALLGRFHAALSEVAL